MKAPIVSYVGAEGRRILSYSHVANKVSNVTISYTSDGVPGIAPAAVAIIDSSREDEPPRENASGLVDLGRIPSDPLGCPGDPESPVTLELNCAPDRVRGALAGFGCDPLVVVTAAAQDDHRTQQPEYVGCHHRDQHGL